MMAANSLLGSQAINRRPPPRVGHGLPPSDAGSRHGERLRAKSVDAEPSGVHARPSEASGLQPPSPSSLKGRLTRARASVREKFEMESGRRAGDNPTCEKTDRTHPSGAHASPIHLGLMRASHL